MTIPLATGSTIAIGTGTVGAIQYSIFGDEIGSSDSFKKLAQGVAPTAAATVYTVPGTPVTQAIVNTMVFYNNSGGATTLQIYVDGTAASNTIYFLNPIPSKATLTFTSAGWRLTDLTGAIITAGSPITATGDATGTQSGSNLPLTLATFGPGAVGPIGSATTVAAVSTDAKGRVSVLSGVSIQIAESQVTNLVTDLAGKQPTGNYITALTGDGTATGPGSVAFTLATVNGAPGTFGSATQVSQVTVNGKGLATTVASVSIQIAESQVTNLVTDLAGKVPTTRLINTTAPLTGGGDLSADRTLAISAATTVATGSMSGPDKLKLDNLWYDVTNYGVSISNSGAANVAAMNTLIQTTAPGSARFFFPATGANYPMTGTITVTQNYQRFIGAGQINSVLFVGNTTQNLFQINDGVAGVEFHDLGFWSTATATAGAVFNVGTASGIGCQQTSFYNLGFNPFGGNFFDLILFNGSRGGEVSFVDGCVMNAFTSRGVAVIGNTTIPTSTAELVISNTIMNGQITGSTGAIAGIYVQQCGAVNVTDCSIILCNNNLLVSPLVSVSQIVASILIENTFFDSSFGSSAKFGGVGAIVRCKFSNCYFTLAAAAPNGSAAFEFTNTAGNAPTGTDFVNCSFLNTFNNANTTFGVLMTNVGDVQHINSKVSGWTTGISVTPQLPAGSTRVQIVGGTVGPAGGIKGNGTGVLLNAGATTYGLVELLGVSFPLASAFGVANTTNLTDNSTIIAGGAKTISANWGVPDGASLAAPTGSFSTVATPVLPTLTTTGVQPNGTYKFEIHAQVINTVAANLVAQVLVGGVAVGGSATMAVGSTAHASPGLSILITGFITFPSATTAESIVNIHPGFQTGAAATGNLNTNQGGTTTAPIAVAANAALQVNLNTSVATCTVIVRQSVVYKVF